MLQVNQYNNQYTRTKIVQGYNEKPILLNQHLTHIFSKIKTYFKDSKINILNVIFRQIQDSIYIILHIPNYTPKDHQFISDIKLTIPNITSLYIHPHKQYNRSNQRIKVYGDYVNIYKFDNNTTINFSIDSFLQANLHTCNSMYNYISNICNKLNITSFTGLGEDTLNISNYLSKYSSLCYVHYQETVDLNSNPNYKSTLDLSKLQSSKLLITTPGRKGFTKQELHIITKLDFEYIIYVSCKPESKYKNFKNLSKYKILQSQTFDMFNNINNSYQESVELWTLPKYISLGDDCSIANLLNNQTTYPLDLCKTANLDLILDILDNNFTPLLDKTNYTLTTISNNFFYIVDKIYQPTIMLKFTYKDKVIKFPHEIRADHKDKDFITYFDRLTENINSFNKYAYKIAVRYETDTKSIKIETINKLLKHFNKIRSSDK